VADPAFHVLSLCSGTAMLDEGVRVAVPTARTVGYVEREAFAAGILLARMADAVLEPAPVWCGPLEDFAGREWRGAVDCITAGFPCQPWSTAGKQQGESDVRWIWPAIADIIDAVRPSLVFLENVPGLVIGRGINRVFGDLARLGFDAEWCSLSAADVGAAHLRKRVFILAVDACGGRRILRESSERCERLADWSDAELGNSTLDVRRPSGDAEDQAVAGGAPHGAGDQLADAEHAIGRTEQSQHGDSHWRDRPGRSGVALAVDADYGSGRREAWPTATAGDSKHGPFAPGPADPRWSDILAGSPWLAPAIESGVRGMVDGNAVVLDESRADQLRAIGNGVVALQAAVAFAVLTRRLLT
jgi:DNA (cytosine-5)-methyltransferase 1